jgi:hypothetical protein
VDNVDLERIADLSEEDLNRVLLLAREELKYRALNIKSNTQLLEEMEENEFSLFSDNVYCVVKDSTIWCMGKKTQKSKFSHSCKFVSIDGAWCWDSDLKISDKMEYQHEPKPTVTTLTKIALVEGLEIDLVSCSASGTTHKVKKIESFVISNGKLTPSLERKIKFIEHR